MKNSNLIIIVVISLVAGYFAYPFFNSQKRSSIEKDLTDGDSAEVQKSKTISPSHYSNGNPMDNSDSIEPSHVNQQIENDLSSNDFAGRGRSEVEFSNSEKSSEANTSGSTSFRGQSLPSSGTVYGSYTLGKTKNQVSVASDDPRLRVLKLFGHYRGTDGDLLIELEVESERSSVKIFTQGGTSLNEELSFSSDNDNFFSNVNDNGNRLEIKKGKTVFYIDLSFSPQIIQFVFDKKIISLEKIN